VAKQMRLPDGFYSPSIALQHAEGIQSMAREIFEAYVSGEFPTVAKPQEIDEPVFRIVHHAVTTLPRSSREEGIGLYYIKTHLHDHEEFRRFTSTDVADSMKRLVRAGRLLWTGKSYESAGRLFGIDNVTLMRVHPKRALDVEDHDD